MMDGWLKDLKDSDKVALAILALGVLICGSSAATCLLVVICAHVQEVDLDRSLTIVKDFFEVGTGLIGASMLALKLQPKSDTPPPPPPIVDSVSTVVRSTNPPEAPKP